MSYSFRIKLACETAASNILSAEKKHVIHVSNNKIEFALATLTKYFNYRLIG